MKLLKKILLFIFLFNLCPFLYAFQQDFVDAVHKKDFTKLKKIVDTVDINGKYFNYGTWTALHEAAIGGSVELIAFLLENHAEIDILSSTMNITPLYHACQQGKGKAAIYLIEHGANYRKVFEDGITYLHLAAIGGDMELVKYLIKKGISINSLDKNGWPPLFWAITARNPSIVKIFVESGADLSIVSRNPGTSDGTVYPAGSNFFDIAKISYQIDNLLYLSSIYLKNKKFENYFYVQYEGVRLRETPGIEDKNKVLKELKTGEKVKFLGKVTHFMTKIDFRGNEIEFPWYYVETSKGLKGWIYGHFIRKEKPDET